ncbi:M3 family oligoendopeptidase [Mycoplasma phocoenae]|uniref:Oligoendopeptidase F family protein n=1 Tax=Mycoplasma phocoenae TaxID=754517 RepID=A0A858U667_9MOLU|nr:M3 family oligoendopeptidase [Mycoplasma phocoenae]QJG66755.1 oligoendopeptidase F family protein [Mycoplasma phocoenae]
MNKKYSSHTQVETEYRWDLNDILKDKTYSDLLSEYFSIYDELIEIKDSKYESADSFLNSLKLNDKHTEIEYKINNYLSNNLSVNVVDPKMNELLEEFENKSAKYSIKFGSEANRMAKNIDKIKVWKDLDEFKNYKLDFETFIDELQHKLSDDAEEYINQTAKGVPSLENIFDILDSSELDRGFATDSKSKKIKITDGNRIQLLKNKDENIRKTTYKNYIVDTYKHRQTLSKLLLQHFKQISVNAKIRRFNSSVESLISEDFIKEELLEIIYKNVSKNSKLLKKYSNAYDKFYKLKFNKKAQKWDKYVDLVKVKSVYSVNEGKGIFKEVVKVFPEKYTKIAHKAMDENWADFMNFPNKATGAYSIGGSYGIDKKYIMMNWDYTLDSVGTLCHEMGHSMHSYFSDITQPINLSQYPIFLAEIASIFNELLLTDYLMNKANTDKEKFNIVSKSIDDFIGTVFRQASWSNYEYELYKALDNDVPLASYEQIEQLYIDVMNRYSTTKKGLKTGDKYNVYSVTVPHFYYNFYVYKYALGYIVANAFYNQYQQNGKQVLNDYIDKFLSAGCSQHPADILLNAGIDIYSESMYEQAFKNLEEKINKYIELGNKIFKQKK